MAKGAIGVFDSGYGGLTILRDIKAVMPDYDYIYIGDNARAPYGNRSFETVYDFTLQAVEKLFEMGSPLVIIACNTASAKALRSIQQIDLPRIDATLRVLGVIRPTAEYIGSITKSRKIGVMGTIGTIQSLSYSMEIKKLYPDIDVFGQPCPMFVPLIENGEYGSDGADYFVKKYIDLLMSQSDGIDTVILGCTHYPILEEKIKKHMPDGVAVISQGKIVAESLEDYLKRHPEIDARCSKNCERQYFTTDSDLKFETAAKLFLGEDIIAKKISLD